MDILAIAIALLSLGASALMAMRLANVESRLKAQTAELKSPANFALPEPDVARPLEGLRVCLAITQDHPHPILANMLKELLEQEDVADIVSLPSGSEPADRDVLIQGEVLCNGYAEIYYEAELKCSTHGDPICSLIEKPPHGDRQGNLAIELITRLKTELEKSRNRNERRSAIRELRD